MSDLLWQLERVSLPGDRTNRLDKVTLGFATGVTAIVGQSGAGKTSLLNILAGLETPVTGSVDCRPTNTGAATSSVHMYWVPQDGGLWPHFSVRQHLIAVLPATNGGRTSSPSAGPTAATNRKDGDSADNLLEKFDLIPRQNAFPSDLSMGERARLAVARSLAVQPAILLMDEPLAHVDPERRLQYWDVIRDYLNCHQASLIFTTHEHETAVRESQWITCMENGQVVWSGATQELYHNPPTPAAGRFLGPVNWFSADEAAVWLPSATTTNEALAVRPESLLLHADENGEAEIVSIQFCGSSAETVLRHVTQDTERTFIHRPPGNMYHIGERIRVDIHS